MGGVGPGQELGPAAPWEGPTGPDLAELLHRAMHPTYPIAKYAPLHKLPPSQTAQTSIPSFKVLPCPALPCVASSLPVIDRGQ